MRAFVNSTERPSVSSGIKFCSALDDMDPSSGKRRYHSGSTPRWYWQEHPCISRPASEG